MSRYRQDGPNACIDVKLATWRQLFDSRDPAPFRERDLDDDAAKYLVACYREVRKAPTKVVLHIGESERQAPAAGMLAESIHSYFAAERELNRAEIRTTIRRGQVWLVAGALFLTLCVLGAQLAAAPGPWRQSLREGLTIIGWVAMWRPVDLLLYSWWPLRDLDRLYRELATIAVEVRYAPCNEDSRPAHLSEIAQGDRT
jgi:hypothetical protein